MNEIYGQYCALIHPSLWEGLPNVVCESLSCGTPVLASNILDHPILVKHGDRGFLFDPHDPQQMADTIMTFLNLSEERLNEMYKNCTAYAQNALALDSIVKEYEAAFSN